MTGDKWDKYESGIAVGLCRFLSKTVSNTITVLIVEKWEEKLSGQDKNDSVHDVSPHLDSFN